MGFSSFPDKRNYESTKKFLGRKNSMGNLKLQAEVLQLSSYCEVIKSIFNDNKELAVPKVLVYSYLIKTKFRKNKIYNANNTKDVIYKSLSLLSGDKYFLMRLNL